MTATKDVVGYQWKSARKTRLLTYELSNSGYAWARIAKWIRRKHNRIGWPELRRRFCDRGWRFASEGVILTGASSVAVSRYRYRGGSIATPWAPKPTAAVPC